MSVDKDIHRLAAGFIENLRLRRPHIYHRRYIDASIALSHIYQLSMALLSRHRLAHGGDSR